MQYPNSLVSKVLQARYYKNSTFLNASIWSNPSYIWRSIIWGRQIIKEWARWRIGNGKNIRIYKDCWIPRPTSFKPISPPSLSTDAVVADLINAENQWDVETLNQHFMPSDADLILKIHLPHRQSEDELMWHFDKKWDYSVKNGYQIALKINLPEEPGCSGSNSNQWKGIWSLALPEKIKIFLWRASNNLLPTAENLWRRKIIQDPIFQRCRRSIESISHALLICKPAKKIWNHAPFPVNKHEFYS